jgi:ubiquinone/menaquinone biosynthesis C-methylase UbiE
MDHNEAGTYWNGNARAWTVLSRAGHDLYRDHVNTPGFFKILPDIRGLKGLDIGCGEGHNTHLLAEMGANLTGIDISEEFIGFAQQSELEHAQGISYQVASAVALPFPDNAFDFATAFMSFMDIPELTQVLSEAHRVIKPGGFLQFSITHPCFNTPYRKNLRNAQGKTYAVAVGDYFHNLNGQIDEWTFGSAPMALRARLPRFQTPRFTLTLSEWINGLIQAGFQIEEIAEPRPSDETVEHLPQVQDAQIVAYFLHIRVRKPQS